MVITGCAYYPEHWPRDRWAYDADLMREAGLSVVRVGEFAWDKFEPEPGVYDFAWMDDAVRVLEAAGLQVIMCTPTPTPPPWLTAMHPEICRVREDGVRISPGGRRHADANVPVYQEYSRLIVEQMAQHYGQHPAIIGWQVDNEFGCGETTRSYSEHSRVAFHHWLQEKYGTLEALNTAWGTQFWGMTYHDWSHIPIPGIVTEPQSPSMLLDYRRFSSDAWVRFQRMQIEILRQYAPDRWITHNFMIRHWSLDYWKLAEDLDVVSFDNYPHQTRGAAEVSMNLDLMRSYKAKPFWIMEQQPGRVNWHPYNPPVPPGQVRLWSHQAVAHGAEAVVYFRFRAARSGQEQYHAGLLKWDGERDQAFTEAQHVCQESQDLPSMSRPRASVGIIFDYDDLWALEINPQHKDFHYYDLVYHIYRCYWHANTPVDFLPRGADLTGYETVIVPAPFLIHEGEVAAWREWVASGGRLIVTFRAGEREASNISTDLTLPGGWTDLIGARVVDAMSIPSEDFNVWPDHHPGTHIRPSSVSPYGQFLVKYERWAESLETDSAQRLFTYADGILSSKVAATINHIGEGEVVYIGCWVDDFRSLLGGMVQRSLQQVDLQGDDGHMWRLTLNHSAQPIDELNSFGVHYARL